jgi:ferredoxin
VSGEHSARINVDWQACQGRGLCHELLPELIALDDWGYPVVTGVVPVPLLSDARSAVRGCPQLALSLLPEPGSRRQPRSERR